MSVPTRTLPSGDELPQLGFGTYRLDGRTATDAVSTALDIGYTHVDTAEGYHNGTAVGEALEGHDREDVFLTSKVLPSNLHYESVLESCAATLDRLGTDYLDRYLVHSARTSTSSTGNWTTRPWPGSTTSTPRSAPT